MGKILVIIPPLFHRSIKEAIAPLQLIFLTATFYDTDKFRMFQTSLQTAETLGIPFQYAGSAVYLLWYGLAPQLESTTSWECANMENMSSFTDFNLIQRSLKR